MTQASPIQPKLLSKLNERAVLESLRAEGPSTRAELAQRMGATFPTVAKAVASLLSASLLEEYQDANFGPGRPAKRLRLSVETAQVIGVALGAGSTSLTAASLDGVWLGEAVTFDPSSDYHDLLTVIAKQVKRLTGRHAKATLGVGVTVPGLVDKQRRVVHFSANMPYLSGKPLEADLQRLTGVDTVVTHDLSAMGIAEKHHGAARGVDNFVLLDHVVGVSLSVMSEGRILSGQNGFAGELGHVPVRLNGDPCVCGGAGCLETVASEWALARRVGERLGRAVEIDEMLQLLVEGHPVVRAEAKRTCKHLAIGVALAVNVFNPERLLIYSRLLAIQPDLMDVLLAQSERLCLRPSLEACQVRLAETGYLDGAIASALARLSESCAPQIGNSTRRTEASDARPPRRKPHANFA